MTKRCYACKVVQDVTNFYRSNKLYYQKECKSCTRIRKGKWHKTVQGKLSTANTKLKQRFGLSLEIYERMYATQAGKCLICGVTESYLGHRLAVDHCHITGQIRGLLCKACNIGIGVFNDNIQSLEAAIVYLRSYEKVKGV
mgnify:CR=1 FL=1